MQNRFLVGKTDGIEIAALRDVPAAIAEVVNSIPVALGPVTIHLTNRVVARGVVIGRLKVLGLIEAVGVSELGVLQSHLARCATDARNVRRKMKRVVTCDQHARRRGTRGAATATNNAAKAHGCVRRTHHHAVTHDGVARHARLNHGSIHDHVLGDHAGVVGHARLHHARLDGDDHGGMKAHLGSNIGNVARLLLSRRHVRKRSYRIKTKMKTRHRADFSQPLGRKIRLYMGRLA